MRACVRACVLVGVGVGVRARDRSFALLPHGNSFACVAFKMF